MIEVETPAGRIAYGPVEADDIPGLLADGLLAGTAQHLRLGVPEEIPFLARQTRLTFARCGIVDPLSLDDYRAHGGHGGSGESPRAGSGRNGGNRARVRSARPRRRRFPHWHQMEDGGRGQG